MKGISTPEILQLIVGVKPFIMSVRFNAPHDTKILVAEIQKCVFIASLFLLHNSCTSLILILFTKSKTTMLNATGDKGHNLQFRGASINPTGSYCSTKEKVSGHTSLLTCSPLSSIAI